MSPGQQLRDAVHESTIQAPGVSSALEARLVERVGYHAVYVSAKLIGANLCLAPAALSLEQFAAQVATVNRAVGIPVIAAPGEGLLRRDVQAALQSLESAGAAAIEVVNAGGEDLPSIVGQAAGARKNPATVIVSRFETGRRGNLEADIELGAACLAAGADWLAPDGLKDFQQFARFADAIEAPLTANMDEFGKSPLLTAEELAELGYAVVLYEMSLLRVAMKSMEGALISLAESGSQHEFLEIMQSEKELAALLAKGLAKGKR